MIGEPVSTRPHCTPSDPPQPPLRTIISTLSLQTRLRFVPCLFCCRRPLLSSPPLAISSNQHRCGLSPLLLLPLSTNGPRINNNQQPVTTDTPTTNESDDQRPTTITPINQPTFVWGWGSTQAQEMVSHHLMHPFLSSVASLFLMSFINYFAVLP